jgi:hypothetical protein
VTRLRSGRSFGLRIASYVPVAYLALLALSTNAAAEAPTAGTLNGGVSLLYGFWVGGETGDINPYGLGLAANAGYTFGVGLHLGAGFQYFFGESQELAPGSTLSLDLRQALGVAGYDVALGSELVLRPALGLGVAWTGAESCQPGIGCDSDSGNHFVASPGVKLLYVRGPFYASGEAAYNRVFSSIIDASGVLVGAGAGLAW